MLKSRLAPYLHGFPAQNGWSGAKAGAAGAAVPRRRKRGSLRRTIPHHQAKKGYLHVI